MDVVTLDLEFDREHPLRCPQCGRDLLSGEALSVFPGSVAMALKNRRLAIPDSVYADLETLAANIRCRVGLCGKTT